MFKITNGTSGLLNFTLGGAAQSLAASATKNFPDSLRAEADATVARQAGVTLSAVGANLTAFGSAANTTARKLLATGGTIQVNDEVKETDTGKVYRWISGTGSADGDWEIVSDATPVATDTAFTPTTSGDWSPAPTTVGGALDQLATRTKALEDA